jgi:L-aminopeptidase/D-esterase-like protein
MRYSGRITDIRGVTVGHWTDATNGTGCTVVLCDPPAIAGIEVRGAAPGSRETELLHPLSAAEWVNGVMLSGGSAFGLDAAGGAVQFLEERGRGVQFGRATIPLVPSAIIFDLNFITHRVRPTAREGYAACQAAGVDFDCGSVGAGTGATVGKLRGMSRAVKGGIGTASVALPAGASRGLGQRVFVGALMVVNAVGSVADPASGGIVAGPRPVAGGLPFEDSLSVLLADPPKDRGFFRPATGRGGVDAGNGVSENTVIGVVATNARLDKRGASRLAVAAQDGIALTVRPAHTSSDGDTVFALATGEIDDVPGPDSLHAAALLATAGAVLHAVESATGLGGVPSASEVRNGG